MSSPSPRQLPQTNPPAAGKQPAQGSGRLAKALILIGTVLVGTGVIQSAKDGAAAAIGTGLMVAGAIGLIAVVIAALRGKRALASLPNKVTGIGAIIAIGVGSTLVPSTEADQRGPATVAQPSASASASSPSTSARATSSPSANPSKQPSASPSASTPQPSATSAPVVAPPPATTQADAHVEPGTALAALALLEIKGRAPKTGYDRDAFGYREYDTDRNGCDTRNDILRRDLTGVTIKAGSGDCVVLTGTLADPYSGQPIAFTRGTATSNDVQIDHVVALSDAWQKGAQGWSADTMHAFANDPLNLLAVSGPLNSQKSDGDAATWLPPNKAYRCEYVARQVAVKYTYGLWVTPAESDAIARILAACPDQGLPAGGKAVPAGGGGAAPAPAAPAAPAPAPAPAAPVVPVAPAPATPAPAPPAPAPAAPGGSVAPLSNGECPPAAPIKGNENSMKYHMPDGQYYGKTIAEQCFATAADAEAAGFVASKR